MKQKERTLSSRRSLIIEAIYAIPFVIAGTLMAPIGKYLFGRQNVQQPGWVDGGDVSEIPDGTPRQIRFERIRFDGWKTRNETSSAWVVLDRSRNITAFSSLCTHLGCAYRWQTEEKKFACPCHGSAFDMQGNVITGPASRPLDQYEAKLQGNQLWLGPLKGGQGG